MLYRKTSSTNVFQKEEVTNRLKIFNTYLEKTENASVC
jgi:hypothetical protein